jgi:hypothetical protein
MVWMFIKLIVHVPNLECPWVHSGQKIELFIVIFPFIIVNLYMRNSNLLFLFPFIQTEMQYLENFPDRVYKSMLIPLMMEDKRAGKIYQTALLLIF